MTAAAGAAIYFALPRDDDGRVIGLDVAVENLVLAFLTHSRQDRLYCHTENEEGFEAFRAKAVAAGRDAGDCEFVPLTAPRGLSAPGCLLQPDPNIAPYAWPRRLGDQRAYSLCGVAHSMSSANVMDAVANCVLYPTQEWDAIICPSRAIADAIGALWAEWRGYLVDRGGARIDCPVQLPVIPLGIDTAQFAGNRDAERRRRQRERLGIADDAFAMLFHGRLSFYSKAHPLPMLLAAERLAAGDTPVHALFMGYFPTEQYERDFHALAGACCERARVTVIRNDDPAFPDGAWAAADAFVSLSDNIQESFGLTPIEAMASGLPVVVSDWDGYRDAVNDGIEGFTVPTLAPPPGNGVALAHRYLSGEDSYGRYIGGGSQTTAVDIEVATAALRRLAGDRELRRRMGAAGARRAESVYDWRHVIPAYEELWRGLAQRRTRGPEIAPRPAGRSAHPLRPDPYRMFAGFPSAHLSDSDRLELATESLGDINRLIEHRMNMFTPEILLDPDAIAKLVRAVEKNPGAAVAELLPDLPQGAPQGGAQEERDRLLRTLTWLLKLGYLRRRVARSGSGG